MPGFVPVPCDERFEVAAGSSMQLCQSAGWMPGPGIERDKDFWWKRLRCPVFAVLVLACTVAWLAGRTDKTAEPEEQASSGAILLVGGGSCPLDCGQSVACTAGASKPVIPQRDCPFFASGGPSPGVTSAVMDLQGCSFAPMDEFNTSWTVNVFQAPGSYFYEVQVGVPFIPFVIEDGFVDFTTATDFNVLNVNNAVPNSDDPKLEITSLAFANDTVLFFANSTDGPLFSLQLLEVLPVTPLRRLNDERRLAEDFFICPGGCVISSLYVNDDFCDCPETCQDEDSWTCATCGAPAPSPPVTPQPEVESQALKKTSIGVGVGIGVGGGLALGLGLGIGLGTGVGTGGGVGTGSAASAAAAAVSAVAAFSAEGSLKLKVDNPQILETEAFTNAIKRSIARIAGSSVVPAMVELIIGCAAASRRLALASLLRRLAETVDVCFKIGVEQEDLAEEVCDTLAGYNAATVATVISSEILDSGIDPGQVSVIGYEPNPNPRANNPNAPSDPIDTPFVPRTSGISLR
eukprot:s2345_g17.t1